MDRAPGRVKRAAGSRLQANRRKQGIGKKKRKSGPIPKKSRLPSWGANPFGTRLGVSAVVTAMNEAGRIGSVLDQLMKLPFQEIVVVVNGSTDATWEQVRRHPSGPLMLHYPEALGHDVVRAAGARVARGDIVLFLDGDIVLPAKRLLPFIRAIARGQDVALNDLTPFLGSFRKRDTVTIAKEFLNRALGRPDLMANSMTAVPHALSRRAIGIIGPERLAVPPLAQAYALMQGLKICAPAGCNVFASNAKRSTNTGRMNPVSELIMGDHLEALHAVMAARGGRLAYPDGIRNRSAVREGSAT
ncbi:glycosyltransferase family 2 protein [Gorillibacterium sp. sgz5001074]|uniref:glycosyltransferase family 2 protein n=1 Tax=Gorillibacterium sp. sgz5001074 TaxID=3446695 RepID=UPI003F66C291